MYENRQEESVGGTGVFVETLNFNCEIAVNAYGLAGPRSSHNQYALAVCMMKKIVTFNIDLPDRPRGTFTWSRARRNKRSMLQ